MKKLGNKSISALLV